MDFCYIEKFRHMIIPDMYTLYIYLSEINIDNNQPLLCTILDVDNDKKKKSSCYAEIIDEFIELNANDLIA